MSGFYFKITLTGYQLSITNHEVDGFSNSFQHVKNSKNLENWLAKFIFTCNLKTRFWKHKDFGRITKATMMHHSTSKKYTLMEQFFFQNLYCSFISEHCSASLSKCNIPFERYWQLVISERYRHTKPHPS